MADQAPACRPAQGMLPVSSIFDTLFHVRPACRFLDVANYPPADGRRERLLAHFNVPEFVANRTCFELNGDFRSKPGYDDASDTKHLTTNNTLRAPPSLRCCARRPDG